MTLRSIESRYGGSVFKIHDAMFSELQVKQETREDISSSYTCLKKCSVILEKIDKNILNESRPIDSHVVEVKQELNTSSSLFKIYEGMPTDLDAKQCDLNHLSSGNHDDSQNSHIQMICVKQEPTSIPDIDSFDGKSSESYERSDQLNNSAVEKNNQSTTVMSPPPDIELGEPHIFKNIFDIFNEGGGAFRKYRRETWMNDRESLSPPIIELKEEPSFLEEMTTDLDDVVHNDSQPLMTDSMVKTCSVVLQRIPEDLVKKWKEISLFPAPALSSSSSPSTNGRTNYYCGGCGFVVKYSGRQYSTRCRECDCWWHQVCSKLTTITVKAMLKSNLTWTCSHCSISESSTEELDRGKETGSNAFKNGENSDRITLSYREGQSSSSPLKKKNNKASTLNKTSVRPFKRKQNSKESTLDYTTPHPFKKTKNCKESTLKSVDPFKRKQNSKASTLNKTSVGPFKRKQNSKESTLHQTTPHPFKKTKNCKESAIDQTTSDPFKKKPNYKDSTIDQTSVGPLKKKQNSKESTIDETTPHPFKKTKKCKDSTIDQTTSDPFKRKQNSKESTLNKTSVDPFKRKQNSKESTLNQTSVYPFKKNKSKESQLDETTSDPFKRKQNSKESQSSSRRSSGIHWLFCRFCNKKFSLQLRLKDHEALHTGDRRHHCEICGKTFSQYPSLKMHLLSHAEPQFQCEYCDKKFTYSCSLVRHYARHRGERNYSCSICKRRFFDSSDLHKHKFTHSTERKFKCTICDKGFLSPDYLYKHQLVHSDARPYKCDVCDKSYKFRHLLVQHKTLHSGDKPFECDICHSKFANQKYLSRHRLIHSRVRAFPCRYCEKSFFDSGNLRRHVTIHTGEYNWQCPKCGRRFNQSGSLGSHLATHERRRFMCDICKRLFKQLSELQNHSEEFHKDCHSNLSTESEKKLN